MALAPYSRRKQKSSHQYLTVAAVIAAVLAAALLVRFLYGEVAHDEKEMTKDYLFEPNAVTMQSGGTDEIAFMEEGTVSYQINANMTYRTAKETLDLMAANPEENFCYLRVRLIGEDGEVLFESGMLKPGTQLKNASLIRVPEKGVYAATAEFEAFDIATLQALGTVQCAVQINVI